MKTCLVSAPHCLGFFFPEDGVGLLPNRACLRVLTLAYYAFPRWYEFGERRWNNILTEENRRTRRKTCPSATLSTTNPTWIDPGVNTGLRGERSATNDLSHVTAPCLGLSSYLSFAKLVKWQMYIFSLPSKNGSRLRSPLITFEQIGKFFIKFGRQAMPLKKTSMQ
jgi:hypothetical protein